MKKYFPTPFPFHKIIQKGDTSLIKHKDTNVPSKDKVVDYKLSVEDSIRNHIRTLILMRIGEFAYDRKLGFEIWDYDKKVFYHEKTPYYEQQARQRGLLENVKAKKHFKENLKKLIQDNEIRLTPTTVVFNFEKVDGNLSVYQRKIVVEVHGIIKSTGKPLSPSFQMSILYTPFKVKSN